ncbi:MAG: hypothetical protein M1833_001509 [Piccolia ochrophora]|nr:MAG: hypothetical protein M1833_001509 [Piccolia ochrophora]
MAGSLVAASQPHRHRHRHVGKRAPDAGTVPEVNVVVYEFEGKRLTQEEYEKGVRDGTFGKVDGDTPAPAQVPSPGKSVDQGAKFYVEKPISSAAPAPSQAAATPDTSDTNSSGTSETPQGDTSQGPVDDGEYSCATGCTGAPKISEFFPNGTIDCSDFESVKKYGAADIHWEGLGGWSGIQSCKHSGDGESIVHIDTKKSAPCSDGDYCSYACVNGYMKSSFPKAQGAKLESIGGLQCKGGKLYLGDGSAAQTLCMKGKGGSKLENKSGKKLAVCATDYPGTESPTIPAAFDAGAASYDLHCPVEGNYYTWDNKTVSLQLYNLGCGFAGGTNWLSIIPNKPTNPSGVLDGVSIEIKSTDPAIKCTYKNGQIYENGKAKDGCTAAGFGSFIFS